MLPIWIFFLLYFLAVGTAFSNQRLRKWLKDYQHALSFAGTLAGAGVFLSLTYTVVLFNATYTHEQERQAANRLSALRALESELYSNLSTVSGLLSKRERYESVLSVPDTKLHFTMLENVLTQGYISERSLRMTMLDAQHRMILVNSSLAYAQDINLSLVNSQPSMAQRHRMMDHFLKTAMHDLELTDFYLKKILRLCPEFQQDASTSYIFSEPDSEAVKRETGKK